MKQAETANQGAPRSSNPVTAIMKNAGTLLTGKAAAGLLSLGYLAIAARALGPEGLGVLVLAHTYALVIAGIARFQSWQAVIRFGAPMLASDNKAGLKQLLRFTIRLDLLSGVFALAIALFFAPHAVRVFDWPPETLGLIYFYCFATPLMIAATPTGVLRLFDKFKTLSAQLTLVPIARFLGAVVLWLAGADLTAFLVIWILSEFLNGASLWWLGLRELGRRDLTPRITGKADAAADKAWLPFMIKTNLSSTIDLMHNNVPLLIVGGVLGPAAAGLFKLAFNLSNLLAQPVNMLNQAIFPELSKTGASAGRDKMVRVAFQSVGAALALAAPIVLLYVLLRRDLPVWVAGDAFAAAAPLVALMAAAQLFRIAALGFESAVLALGRAGWALVCQTAGGLVHIGVLLVFLTNIGVIAAPIAIMAGWAVLIAGLLAGIITKSNEDEKTGWG